MLQLLKAWKLALDLLILALLSLPIIYFNLYGVHVRRGFYCDDDSIRYPYRKSTIPSKINYAVGFSLTFIVILIVEANRVSTRPRLELVIEEPRNGNRKRLVARLYRYFSYFLFGFCLNLLLTYVGKFGVGRLRPHFLAVCQPNDTLVNICPQQPHLYITSFDCYGKDEEKIEEARDSFPSGHSAFSFYCAAFIVLYLQARVHLKFSRFALALVQFICFTLAVIVAVSRIADYKHHWSDVAVGSVLGASVAYTVTVHIGRMFAGRRTEEIGAQSLVFESEDSALKL